MLQVRFIAITDGIDSIEEERESDQIIVPFKNLINDAYCRDISIKIRSQLDVKRKCGKFIGSFAGYGYQKDPKDKNHLIPDEPAANIVRLIFDMKTEGYKHMEIHFTFSDLLERAMDETGKRRKETIEFDMLCSDKNNFAI